MTNECWSRLRNKLQRIRDRRRPFKIWNENVKSKQAWLPTTWDGEEQDYIWILKKTKCLKLTHSHDYITEVTDTGSRHDLQDDPFEMLEKWTVVYKLMYMTLSIFFNMSGNNIHVGWMEGLKAIQQLGRMAALAHERQT